MFIVTYAIESFFFVFQLRCTRLGQAAGTVGAGFDISAQLLHAPLKNKKIYLSSLL